MAFLHSFTISDLLGSPISLFAALVLGTLIGAERQYRQYGGTQIIAYGLSKVGFPGVGTIFKQGRQCN